MLENKQVPVSTSENAALLEMFSTYCKTHPQQRFWQALCNWSGYGFIYAANDTPREGGANMWDTFYWESDYKEWPRK